MGRYRKIEVRIWNDEKFRRLSDRGKLVFFFLLTHPHLTSFGAMRATEAGLAAELGWQPKAFRKAFREALSEGMVKASPDDALVVLPNFLKYNPPQSGNVVKSWGDQVELIPECHLQAWYYQHVKAFVEGMSKAFREALPKAFSLAGARAPVQEQEQEQEQDSPPKGPPTGGDRDRRAGDFERFWSVYPKRVGKGAAVKAFAKVDVDVERLVAAVEVQAQSPQWQTEGGRFIPNPSTWLNQRRWEDEAPRPRDGPVFSDASRRAIEAGESFLRRHADED